MAHVYGKAMTAFWAQEGKKLRGNADALALVLYLISSHHANGLGLYHLPFQYIIHDLGLSEQRVSDALTALFNVGWLQYDADGEVMLIERMAENEIADPDNKKRQLWVQGEFERLPESFLLKHWLIRYRKRFGLYPYGLGYCPHHSIAAIECGSDDDDDDDDDCDDDGEEGEAE
jgi:hypothetical protein